MTVGVLIDDFSLLHRVLERLKPAGLALEVLTPDQPPPPRVRLLLVAPGQRRDIELPQLEADELDLLPFRVRYLFAGQPAVTAGVDPGGRTGVAVVWRDGSLLARECGSVEAVTLLARIAALTRLALVRVGRGAPAEGSRLVRALVQHGLRVELVDESSTGSGDHAAAAERIARLSGRPPPDDVYAVRDGEIAQLQARSRSLSGGRFTLSREIARRVAAGELTLTEALAEVDPGVAQE